MGRKVVITLSGRQGVGKTTLGKKLARYLGTSNIEVSDLVKAHTAKSTKKDLASTRHLTQENPNWLGELVYEDVQRVFNADDTRVVVLSGTREVEVLEYLKRRQVLIIGIDIQADPAVRYQRLLDNGKISSPREFIEQDLREERLGVLEVTGQARYLLYTSDTSSPEELVRAIVTKITKDKTAIR